VVIALHGGPGGDLAYQRALLEPVDGKRLADDHRVILWDQRGTGLSRRHDTSGLSMAKYHADLEALVDAVAPGRQVVFVGH
jgi:proline iminopeptidase